MKTSILAIYGKSAVTEDSGLDASALVLQTLLFHLDHETQSTYSY
jgi:hypothetical protein